MLVASNAGIRSWLSNGISSYSKRALSASLLLKPMSLHPVINLAFFVNPPVQPAAPTGCNSRLCQMYWEMLSVLMNMINRMDQGISEYPFFGKKSTTYSEYNINEDVNHPTRVSTRTSFKIPVFTLFRPGAPLSTWMTSDLLWSPRQSCSYYVRLYQFH